jgi:filamentous hemagglutinin
MAQLTHDIVWLVEQEVQLPDGTVTLSGGAGVAVNLSSQGKAAGVTASVSGARGRGEGTDVNWTSTHVSAGNRLVLESGGDTTLKGIVRRQRDGTRPVAWA